MANNSSDMESLAQDIQSFAKKLRVDTFLSFLEAAEQIKRFAALYASQKKASMSGFNLLNTLIIYGCKGGGRMTPTEISKKMSRSRYTVTRLVDTLEKQGLVKREPVNSSKDRRVREVRITRKGLELVKDNYSVNQEKTIQAIFDPLNIKSIEDLNVTLKQLKTHLAAQIAELKPEDSRYKNDIND